jgi:hypothetical protein
MSLCSCDVGEGEYLVWKERGPHVARKEGHDCLWCGGPCLPGDLVLDFVWIDYEGRGGFRRMHEICYALADEWTRKVCGSEGGLILQRFPWGEAAAHAVAEGHDPFWRSWLELLELAWGIQPEPLSMQEAG